jgi:hypothetical protein
VEGAQTDIALSVGCDPMMDTYSNQQKVPTSPDGPTSIADESWLDAGSYFCKQEPLIDDDPLLGPVSFDEDSFTDLFEYV